MLVVRLVRDASWFACRNVQGQLADTSVLNKEFVKYISLNQDFRGHKKYVANVAV